MDEEAYYELVGRAGGRCEVCGAPLVAPQLAHRIPQRFRQYGPDVLHHPLNLAVVCSLKCNDAVSISNHPLEIERLVKKIRGEL